MTTPNRTAELKQPISLDSVRRMLRDSDTYGTTLLIWAIDHFGFDPESKQPWVLVWHPQTIRLEIEHTTGVDMPKNNFDKLMAAVVIVTTDVFFKDAGRFNILANVLSGDDFQPDEYSQADSAEIAWAVTEALLLVPPDNDDPEPFSDHVRYFIGHVLKHEGYVTPPDILRIALDAEHSARIKQQHGDDPELYESINHHQQAKSQEIAGLIREGLGELLRQVKALVLQHGSTTELEQRIGKTLRSDRP